MKKIVENNVSHYTNPGIILFVVNIEI